MELLQVNKKTCTKCGFCAGVCPGGIIEHQPKSNPKMGPQFEKLCIRCGACVAACQAGALSLENMPAEACTPIDPSLNINVSQIEQFLRSRRSIRAYKEQAVRKNIIQKLIEVARYAPTGHNNQEVEWLVIDNKDELLKIEKAAVDWIKLGIKQNPQMAEMMDFKGLLEKQEKFYNGILRDAPALIVAHAVKNNPIASIDCTIALTYFELAAKSINLGTCWAGFALIMATTFPPVQQILALPEGHQAYGCMMLGIPKYAYRRLPARKEPKIIWRE